MERLLKFGLESDYDLVKDNLLIPSVSYTNDSDKVWLNKVIDKEYMVLRFSNIDDYFESYINVPSSDIILPFSLDESSSVSYSINADNFDSLVYPSYIHSIRINAKEALSDSYLISFEIYNDDRSSHVENTIGDLIEIGAIVKIDDYTYDIISNSVFVHIRNFAILNDDILIDCDIDCYYYSNISDISCFDVKVSLSDGIISINDFYINCYSVELPSFITEVDFSCFSGIKYIKFNSENPPIYNDYCYSLIDVPNVSNYQTFANKTNSFIITDFEFDDTKFYVYYPYPNSVTSYDYTEGMTFKDANFVKNQYMDSLVINSTDNIYLNCYNNIQNGENSLIDNKKIYYGFTTPS